MDPEVFEYDVVCRAIGCENEGRVIRIQAEADPIVVCGPCGAEITDIIPIPSD